MNIDIIIFTTHIPHITIDNTILILLNTLNCFFVLLIKEVTSAASFFSAGIWTPRYIPDLYSKLDTIVNLIIIIINKLVTKNIIAINISIYAPIRSEGGC